MISSRDSFGYNGNKRHFKFPYKRLYTRLLASAARKNQEVSLTYEEFLKFTKEKHCYYCNAPLEWVKHGKKANKYNLDRLNPNKGYHKNNVAPCCWTCNNLKSATREGKFLAHIKRICDNLDL